LHRPTLLAGCVVIAAGVVTGCSDSRITTPPGNAAVPNNELRVAARPAENRPATTEIAQRVANSALDDRQLGGIRGGMTTTSGMVVNFSFQEATYVNHNLTQSIIVPTITFSPGSGQPATASIAAGGSTVPGIASTATHTQVSAPSQVVQSVVNSGMTSVVTSLGAGGVTSHISNAANNQLVQQVITANIGVTGLGQAIQQSVASTVMSRVQAASTQFR
jgi:hypothetical protein